MIIYNILTNTSPLIAHSQGSSKLSDRWLDLESKLADLNKVKIPDNLTILTFATYNIKKPLIDQLKASGVEYINCAEGLTQWRNKLKIPLALENLKKVRTDYVLILDAEDIILCEDLGEIIDRYLEYQCKILFGSSIMRFPAVKGLDNSILGKGYWKYLNAGTVIGDKNSLIEFYEIVNSIAIKIRRFDSSEQYRIKLAYTKYKGVKFDYKCNLFQTLSGTDWSYNTNTQLLEVYAVSR